MSRSWVFWYPEDMGCQERLWCAAQMDDLDEAMKSIHNGASATLPGPKGSAKDLANIHRSSRILSKMGWGVYTDNDEDISLEELDFAIQQVDGLKHDLELEMPGDDFLELLPFLGNAALIEDNPYTWAIPDGVSKEEARTLFRLTHEYGTVIAMSSVMTAPVLLLSPSGAKKWAPRLLQKGTTDEHKNLSN